MRCTIKIHLKKLDGNTIGDLEQLSRMTAKLYNLAIEIIDEHYRQTGEVYEFQNLKRVIKDSAEYKAITGKYCNTLGSAISNYKSYISRHKRHYTATCPKPRKYYPTSTDYFSCKDNRIYLPSTAKTPEICLPIPEDSPKNINSVLIKCKYGKEYYIHITYDTAITNHNLNTDNALGLDLGVINFCTGATTTFESFIIDGRELKSIIQGYWKYKKRLSNTGSIAHSKRLLNLYKRTQDRIEDYVNKSVSYVVDFAIRNNCGVIYLGWGEHFHEYKLGINDDMFNAFPFKSFKDKLFHQCRKNNIHCQCVLEYGTSQASFIDNDPVVRSNKHSGTRRYRGLYISKKTGQRINSDVNACLNLLRKANHFKADVGSNLLGHRGIAEPERIRF